MDATLYHDTYHIGTVMDLINCRSCQAEWVDVMFAYTPVDRLEDLDLPYWMPGHREGVDK